MKTFEVTFNSKKTQHPEGELQHVFEVQETTKRKAAAVAMDALMDTDPENVSCYKSPKITVVETKEIKPEPEPEPEPKPDLELEPTKPTLSLKNGTYDMPSAVYHSANGVSSSMIKKSCESMMLYKKLYITKEIEQPQSDALRFGSLFHTLVLEPEKLNEEYLVLDESIDRRTKAGKEAYKEAMEKADAEGLMVVTASELDHAQAMAAAAVNDKYANRLLRAPTRRTEVSFFDTHSETGLTVKVRPDLIVGDICVDLKSVNINRTVDGEWMLEHLRREVLKYKYHLSAAMYLNVAKLREFVWIFVNKAHGYHWVAVVRASEMLLAEGEDLYHTQMHRISEAQVTDEWLAPLSILPIKQGSKTILPTI